MEKIINKSLAEKLEEKIKEGKIKMKPKWFFVLKTIFNISFIFILFLGAIYLGNFILFIFHEHKTIFDSLNVNPFNADKILNFVKMIPGLLFLLLIIFIFTLYKLIKDFAYIYRKNFLYIVFILLILVISAVVNFHFIFDKDFRFARFGEKGEMPFLQGVHKYYRPDFYPDKSFDAKRPLREKLILQINNTK